MIAALLLALSVAGCSEPLVKVSLGINNITEMNGFVGPVEKLEDESYKVGYGICRIRVQFDDLYVGTMTYLPATYNPPVPNASAAVLAALPPSYELKQCEQPQR